MEQNFIKDWRKSRGMTQVQLAEAMGVSRPYVTLVEIGKRRWDQPFLLAAAKALDCSIVDLLVRRPGDRESIDALLATVGEDERARIEVVVRAMLTPPVRE
jgi:transcriptional regulator with XRE-family HTH domain